MFETFLALPATKHFLLHCYSFLCRVSCNVHLFSFSPHGVAGHHRFHAHKGCRSCCVHGLLPRGQDEDGQKVACDPFLPLEHSSVADGLVDTVYWYKSHSQIILHETGLIPRSSCMRLVSFPGHPAWGWFHPQTILCVYTYMVTLHHQYRSLDWVCPVCGVANRNLLPRCK